MSRRVACVLTLTVALASVVMPARAHHSFGAEYDSNQPVTVKGVVTRIEWTNPHSFLHLDVVDASGAKASWKFEGYPPNALSRTGWKREATIKPGDTVTVTRRGSPATARSTQRTCA